MWRYDRVLVRLGVRVKKALSLRSAMLMRDEVDEILLVCGKMGGVHSIL